VDLACGFERPQKKSLGNERIPRLVSSEFDYAQATKSPRAAFKIVGNKYPIVVWINYPYRVVYIRFIGTQRQYDEIDAQTV
jgi:mRNA interferase HigB